MHKAVKTFEEGIRALMEGSFSINEVLAGNFTEEAVIKRLRECAGYKSAVGKSSFEHDEECGGYFGSYKTCAGLGFGWSWRDEESGADFEFWVAHPRGFYNGSKLMRSLESAGFQLSPEELEEAGSGYYVCTKRLESDSAVMQWPEHVDPVYWEKVSGPFEAQEEAEAELERLRLPHKFVVYSQMDESPPYNHAGYVERTALDLDGFTNASLSVVRVLYSEEEAVELVESLNQGFWKDYNEKD